MNRSVTVLLLVFVVLLGAGLFVLRPLLLEKEEFRGTGGYLLDFAVDDVTGLSISRDGERFDFERHADGWTLGPEPKDSASSLELGKLISSVQNLKILDSIPAKEFSEGLRDEEYGLPDSKLKLRLQLEGGAVRELFFGREGVFPNSVFVRVGRENKNTYLVGQEVARMLQEPITHFRERRLVPLPVGRFEKILINSPEGELELEKKGDHWVFLRPMQARADSEAVNRLLELILGAAVLEFRDAEPKTAGGEWRGEIQLWTDADEPPLRIRLGRKEGEEIEVFSSARLLAAQVPAENFLLFELPLQELRDKSLIRFSSDLIDRVFVKDSEGEFWILRSPENEWQVEEEGISFPVNDENVEKILAAFRALNVRGFVPLTSSKMHALVGNPATLHVDLLSWVSENTPEALAGAHSVHALRFFESESEVFVQIDDEPELRKISPESFLEMKNLFQGLKAHGEN